MSTTISSRRTAHRFVVSAITTLALVSPATQALRPAVAHAAVVAEPSSSVALEVEVDSGIVEASDLRGWIEEDARGTLDALPSKPVRRGSVRVAIAGALYDYQVTLTAVRGGETMGTPSTWGCECSNEELLEKLRGELPQVASELEVVEEVAVAVAPEPEIAAVELDDRKRRRKRAPLGPAGGAGVALMVVGASGLATGVAFMVMEPKHDKAYSAEYVRDLQSSGALIVGASVGLFATGLTLYLLRGRRAQRSVVKGFAPSLDDRGNFALTATGRF